jgi:crossover junction endodeoxyribonuclease RuvC
MPFNQLSRTDPLIVCGIDPGTRAMGFGIVGRRGRRFIHIDHGAFVPPAESDAPARLLSLKNDLASLLAHHSPHVIALEEAFVHRNIQSALRLGEARGVAMIVAAAAAIPVVQYATAVAKKSVTGHGSAGKEVVQDMVTRHLDLPHPPQPHDAADGLALALCLLFDPRLDPRFAAASDDA